TCRSSARPGAARTAIRWCARRAFARRSGEGGSRRGERGPDDVVTHRSASGRVSTLSLTVGGRMRLEGVHHVTAITGDVLQNVDFHTRVLALRLVGKPVNQDDASVYHVFFSDEHGHPGSDTPFFESRRAARGRAGAGMVYRVEWRVSGPAALDFW